MVLPRAAGGRDARDDRRADGPEDGTAKAERQFVRSCDVATDFEGAAKSQQRRIWPRGRRRRSQVADLRKDDKLARRLALNAQDLADNHLCPTCIVDHWTYVLTKYNARFGIRFLDIPATLDMLDARDRGEPVHF